LLQPVDIVEYFLPRFVTDPEPLAAGSTAEKRSLVREVFTESAANEHLEVLKLMMGIERLSSASRCTMVERCLEL